MNERPFDPWSRTVLWPCADCPHSTTVRATFFRRAPYALTHVTYSVIVFAFLGASLVVPYALGGSFKDGPSAIVLAYLSAATVAALALGVRWLLHKPIHRGLKFVGFGEAYVKQWRSAWSKAERESDAFKEFSKNVPLSLALPNAWSTAPRLPSLTRYSTQLSTKTTLSVPGGEGVEPFLGRVLLALASIGGQSVVGRLGTDTACAIFMFSQPIPTQLWVLVTATTVGNTISVTVSTDVQWWGPPGLAMADGSTLRGDMRVFSQPTLLEELRDPGSLLLYLLVPLGGCLTAIAYVKTLANAIRRPEDTAAILHGWMHPDYGDSLDLAILMRARTSNNLESLRPHDTTMQLIHGLRQELLGALQWAATPPEEAADTGPVASRASVDEDEPEED